MDFKIHVVSTKKCFKQTRLLIHDGMERYWNIWQLFADGEVNIVK